jgi:hypothetical protein
MINNFLYPGINNHLGTQKTGAESGIQNRLVNRYSVLSGLNYRVFLSMTAKALFQPFTRRRIGIATGATAFITVCNSPGSSIVSGRNYLSVLNDYRRDLPATTIAPPSHHMGYFHKIFIPIRAFAIVFCHLDILKFASLL